MNKLFDVEITFNNHDINIDIFSFDEDDIEWCIPGQQLLTELLDEHHKDEIIELIIEKYKEDRNND